MEIVSFFKRLIQEPKPHWIHAGLTFLITVLAAGVLLPLVRVQPESVHDYLNGLHLWIRISFAFALCVIFTAAMFKLLTPRAGHLAHWRAYPPAWLAAVVAWIVVAVVDVLGGFDTDGYRATVWEWIGYSGGSVLLVGWYSGLWSELARWFQRKPDEHGKATDCVTLQDIKNAPWEEIEAWLESDDTARYDFLGNQSVAHRVSFCISEGTRSVGIVGPYGAGKTSIVHWVADRLKRHEVGGRKFFVCHHSCWGFETSASAIHDMLSSAVSKLSEEIDTFQVDSLPESYRQTFSAGGDWVETISNLVLRTPDPMDQFSRLSEVLRDIGGRLIFIVEDLDRNETRNFEIQEVLAFLERSKEYSNLSFILTGGLSSSQRIDYAKLCDQIEFLRTIEPHQSSALIERVNERCLDNAVFPHVRLCDQSRNYEWNPLSGMLIRDYEEFSLPQAVALLLNTPRSLRHALGRTFLAWRTLHGEIDFNHLLAVNVLRFGAPECFQFLMRRWNRLRSTPEQTPTYGRQRVKGVRQQVLDDWKRTIRNVEWNSAAAVKVMEFILPATEYWLVDDTQQGSTWGVSQGVDKERYWRRAVNESVDREDVRDQRAIRETADWIGSPRLDAPLVDSICTSDSFCGVWRDIAGDLFNGQPDQILLLCEHVLTRIRNDYKACATHGSQGFEATCFFAERRIPVRAENAEWLRERITEACSVSIELVNGLWHYWSTGRSPIRLEDREGVRLHAMEELRRTVTSSDELISRLHPELSATLYQLVLDPGNEGQEILADAQSWCWLGPHILEGVRDRNVLAAANCGVLLGARVSGRERMTVDIEVLDQFFGDRAAEVIDILDSMIDQLPDSDQSLVRNVVRAARQHLAGGTLPDEQEGETDAN